MSVPSLPTPAAASAEPPPSSPSKKKTGSIVVNLSRCRYEVVREAAESLKYKIDYDLENVAMTLSKTIDQPVPPSNNNNNPSRSSASSSSSSSLKATAAVSVVANAPQVKSNMAMISAGFHLHHNGISRPPVLHDAVFAMIEAQRAHIMWSDVTVTPQQVGLLAPWQRLNHFPGISATLSRKVPLAQTMMRAWRAAPDIFAGLVPLSFSLKRDAAMLRQYFEEIEFSKTKLKKRKNAQKQGSNENTETVTQQPQAQPQRRGSSSSLLLSSATNPFLMSEADGAESRPKVFIFKPNAGCMGHDIKLTCRPLQMLNRLLAGNTTSRFMKEDEDFVCQVYIDRPLLIEKRKFDLRVYVLLLGVTPNLRVLVHREGLVRLCASEYVAPKPSNVRKATIHLTNYAVNKKKLGKECDAARTRGSETQQLEDEDEEEDNNDDEAGGAAESAAGASAGAAAAAAAAAAASDATLQISGIKRDFAFLNQFLDASVPGGSAETWRQIDRSIVLSLMAAHDELDRTYRKSATGTHVLLRRAAMQFLKERRDSLMSKKKEMDDKLQQQQHQSKKSSIVVAQEDPKQSVSAQDQDDDDDDEEEDDTDADDESGKKSTTTASTASPDAMKNKKADGVAVEVEFDEEAFIQDCCIGRSCFELLGYDLLLTEEGRPIIMEINHGPSLETGADIDTRIKTQVLADLFRHVSVLLPETKSRPLRQRRYLQRVVRSAKNRRANCDLELNPPTGFRVVYPLLPASGPQAEEYKRAQGALHAAHNVQQHQQQQTQAHNQHQPLTKQASFRANSGSLAVAAAAAAASGSGLPPIKDKAGAPRRFSSIQSVAVGKEAAANKNNRSASSPSMRWKK